MLAFLGVAVFRYFLFANKQSIWAACTDAIPSESNGALNLQPVRAFDVSGSLRDKKLSYAYL